MNALRPDHAWRGVVRGGLVRSAALVAGSFTLTLCMARAWTRSRARIDAVDGAWHDRMVAWAADSPLAFARVLEFLGGPLAMTTLRIVIAVGLAATARRSRFRLWLYAIVSSQVLSLILKESFDRARPADRMTDTIGSSFPSGHTTNAAAIAFALAFIATRPGRTRALALFGAGIWTITMGWSRTYLRDHWLSDVAAGGGLGVTCALLAALAVARNSR